MKSRSEAPRVQMHLVPAMSCSLGLPHAIVKFSKCSYELSPTAVLMGARGAHEEGMQWWLPGEDRQTQQLPSTAPASANGQDVQVVQVG